MKKYSFLLKLQATLLIGLIAYAVPSQAQTLSTLFTSPDQRTNLDQLRLDYLAKTEAENFDISEAIAAEDAEGEADTIKPVTEFYLGAIMSSANKERSIWLNDQALYESELPSNMSVANSSVGLALLIRVESKEYELLPGQILDTATGLIEEYSPVSDQALNASNEGDSSPQTQETSVLDSTDEPPSTEASSGEMDLNNLQPSDFENPALLQALQVLQAFQGNAGE